MISVKVNKKTYNVDVEPETPLLWVIRDTIGLTGTKFGCGVGLCGAQEPDGGAWAGADVHAGRRPAGATASRRFRASKA